MNKVNNGIDFNNKFWDLFKIYLNGNIEQDPLFKTDLESIQNL